MLSFVLQLLFMIVIVSGDGEKPVLQPFAVPKEVLAGQKFKLGCVMSSGSLPVTFYWYKDNQLVQADRNIMIRHAVEDYSELVVRQIGLADVGKYKCVAKNVAGRDQTEVDVRVKGKD